MKRMCLLFLFVGAASFADERDVVILYTNDYFKARESLDAPEMGRLIPVL